MFQHDRTVDEGEQQLQQATGLQKNYNDREQQLTSPVGFDSDLYTGTTPLLSSPRDHVAAMPSSHFDDSSSSSSSSSPLIDEVLPTTTSTNPKSNSSDVIKPFEQEFSQHHALHYHYAHKQYWLQNFSASIADWLYPPGVPRSCQLLRKENLAVPASYLLVGILQGKHLYSCIYYLITFLCILHKCFTFVKLL